jgi:hypothetical protein
VRHLVVQVRIFRPQAPVSRLPEAQVPSVRAAQVLAARAARVLAFQAAQETPMDPLPVERERPQAPDLQRVRLRRMLRPQVLALPTRPAAALEHHPLSKRSTRRLSAH